MVKKGLMKQAIEVKRIFSWIIMLVVNKNIFLDYDVGCE